MLPKRTIRAGYLAEPNSETRHFVFCTFSMQDGRGMMKGVPDHFFKRPFWLMIDDEGMHWYVQPEGAAHNDNGKLSEIHVPMAISAMH